MWTLDTLRDLYAHMEWADEEVWRATATLPAGPVDSRLRGLLLHLHVVQRAFLLVWSGKEVTFPEVESFPALADVRAWAEPYYLEVQAFLATVTQERLAEEVRLPWADEMTAGGRPPFAPTLGETMFQVTSHSTYHRGQVNARLRELGTEPPLVDYIAWLWFGRPSHNKSSALRV
jgi:uncharacterized damage-inducible protein DinB